MTRQLTKVSVTSTSGQNLSPLYPIPHATSPFKSHLSHLPQPPPPPYLRLQICQLFESNECPTSAWKPVFRIHYVLVQIRIWIRGSAALTNGSCFFVSDFQLSRRQKKIFANFFAYYLFRVHLQKILNHKDVTKQEKVKVFLTIFA